MQYYLIHNHEIMSYGINRNGEVFDCEDGNLIPIKPKIIDGKAFVIINGNKYEIGRLLLQTFVGDLNLPIKYKENVIIPSLDDVSYDLSNSQIIKVDEMNLTIDGIPFRRFPDIDHKWLSKNGTLYNSKRNIFIRQYIDEDGYTNVKTASKVIKTHRLNRLVWLIWVGDIPDLYEINHINHKKWDNDLDNLECISNYDNLVDAINYNKMTLVTYELFEEVLRLKSKGKTNKEISKLTNISIDHLVDLYSGNFHKDWYNQLKDKYEIKIIRNTSNEDLKNMYQDLQNGSSIEECMEKYNKSYRFVRDFKNGHGHKRFFEELERGTINI